jgi:tRNA threonylcarbamoyladenosine biosynthesis protein TsaE
MEHHHYHLRDEAATARLGMALARAIEPGLALHLHGDLGAGKTALARALIHAAGYSGHVKSPTYTLCEPYPVELHGRAATMLHFDLYRMSSAEEFLDAGFREEFNSDNICLVEWPEKAAPVLPSPDIAVFLQMNSSGRDVELQALSDLGQLCLDRLKFAPDLG